jgi:hypothetical protein
MLKEERKGESWQRQQKKKNGKYQMIDRKKQRKTGKDSERQEGT